MERDEVPIQTFPSEPLINQATCTEACAMSITEARAMSITEAHAMSITEAHLRRVPCHTPIILPTANKNDQNKCEKPEE